MTTPQPMTYREILMIRGVTSSTNLISKGMQEEITTRKLNLIYPNQIDSQMLINLREKVV